ncbi:hypothetical protein [Diaphorobacter aerolatus]|uniref:Uncharacterized protein n=1 Tax=Diaphorobacter aerolatus TaxID=1288495 RepID=A0A7H0GG10_9BURK|nr:hypothetical protein [Diaphorobacter aerolatus]QNP47226.1 hypothetical protein H9K75_12620 [Diaphorobacter aerolatus]
MPTISPCPPLSRHHRTRLMQIWRSAGWPCQDALEIELLAAGLACLQVTPEGHERLRLTDTAIALLADARQKGVRSITLHDRIEHRFAQQQLLPQGRIVWRELMLRAALEEPVQPAAVPAGVSAPGDMLWPDEAQLAPEVQRAARRIWRVARPDLFSIRNTSTQRYLHPLVHEVKASRADLLSDLRHQAKRLAYHWLSEECHYVFPAGIAEPEELPEEYGVWVMHGNVDDAPRFELLRPARHANCRLPFAVWMALCKATPLQFDEELQHAQVQLGSDEPRGGNA